MCFFLLSFSRCKISLLMRLANFSAKERQAASFSKSTSPYSSNHSCTLSEVSMVSPKMVRFNKFACHFTYACRAIVSLFSKFGGYLPLTNLPQSFPILALKSHPFGPNKLRHTNQTFHVS